MKGPATTTSSVRLLVTAMKNWPEASKLKLYIGHHLHGILVFGSVVHVSLLGIFSLLEGGHMGAKHRFFVLAFRQSLCVYIYTPKMKNGMV